MLFMVVAKGAARNIYATQSSPKVFASGLHAVVVSCAVRVVLAKARELLLCSYSGLLEGA